MEQLLMNKSTKLTDTLDAATIVKKYLKVVKATDWKTADRLAKLFPYLLTKPKWEKENPEDDYRPLVITAYGNPVCDSCIQLQIEAEEKENRRTAEERAKDINEKGI